MLLHSCWTKPPDKQLQLGVNGAVPGLVLLPHSGRKLSLSSPFAQPTHLSFTFKQLMISEYTGWSRAFYWPLHGVYLALRHTKMSAVSGLWPKWLRRAEEIQEPLCSQASIVGITMIRVLISGSCYASKWNLKVHGHSHSSGITFEESFHLSYIKYRVTGVASKHHSRITRVISQFHDCLMWRLYTKTHIVLPEDFWPLWKQNWVR